eukprot:symbB.v1.2.012089.t1/scaffold822.1/size350215/16
MEDVQREWQELMSGSKPFKVVVRSLLPKSMPHAPVEARMQQMEADGLEIEEDSLTVLLLAYGYAKPQQTLLAEQMFKQQMLRGKVRATREVLEALRLAVGGARCLQLRRELQIGSEKKSPDAAIDYAAKSAAGKNRKPKGRSRIWKSFLPPDPPAKRLKWE